MSDKGFTLVELLAVIIILGVIALITVPIVTNIVDKAENDAEIAGVKQYINAVEDYLLSANANENTMIKDGTCIIKSDSSVVCGTKSFSVETKNNKVTSGILTIQDYSVVKASKLKLGGNIYSIDSDGEVSVETPLNISKPILFNNTLTPVIYSDGNWIVADSSEIWYDYETQWWANAVLLKNSKNVGDIVNVDGFDSDIYAMYVWVPRYEYKIQGDYGKSGTSTTIPGEIEVNFISKEKTTPSTGYHINSGFTFGNTNLSGIWVGKFETSHMTLSTSTNDNNLGCSNENCTNADGLRILPNVQALRRNNNSNFFYASRSMGRSGNPFGINSSLTDSHMMKNSEWGIAAYLSQSKYGKYGNSDYNGVNKEIYINNSSSRYTGRSGGTAAANSENKNYTYNVDINGTGASTTGNIYGIYDMNGGSWERTMANYNGYLGSSGFSTLPASKYYDRYTTNIGASACNGTCYGHAVSETANWYSDFYMRDGKDLAQSTPWIGRSGGYSDTVQAGIFYINGHNGAASAGYSFRLVLTEP